MKVKVETGLFEVPFGSHLYGTNGPNSDLDFKVVCLPSHETLLMNIKVTNRKVTPEGKKEGEKMGAGEAEYEYIPLQIFLDDFFNGQTYALEIAFAVRQGKYETDIESLADGFIEKWMDELIEKFLTRNVSKMVGYAVSQSRNYGLKTERYTSLRVVLEAFDKYMADAGVAWPPLNKVVLKDHPELVKILTSLKHVKECEILNGSGGTTMAPAIDICGKEFPLTANFQAIISSIKGSIDQYGERVKKYDGQGVDWKALSHAIRITEQVIELCTHGTFNFPRPNAPYLKDVKEGKVELDEALNYLTECFNKVDNAVFNSILQERTPALEEEFKKFKINLLSQYYGV